MSKVYKFDATIYPVPDKGGLSYFSLRYTQGVQ